VCDDPAKDGRPSSVSIKIPGMITLAYRAGTEAGIVITSDREDMTAAIHIIPTQNVIKVRRDQVLRLICP
jgi:hypothetical protein